MRPPGISRLKIPRIEFCGRQDNAAHREKLKTCTFSAHEVRRSEQIKRPDSTICIHEDGKIGRKRTSSRGKPEQERPILLNGVTLGELVVIRMTAKAPPRARWLTSRVRWLLVAWFVRPMSALSTFWGASKACRRPMNGWLAAKNKFTWT